MTVKPQILAVGGGGAAADLVLSVPKGSTSATFTYWIANDYGSLLGADETMTRHLKVIADDGEKTVDSGLYQLDAMIVRARVTGTIGTTAYESQTARLGTAHFLQLPPLPVGAVAVVEIYIIAPADATLDAVQLILTTIPGTVPTEPDVFLDLEESQAFATITDLPTTFAAAKMLKVAAELDEIVVDLSELDGDWTGGAIDIDVLAADPGAALSTATSIIGTGTTPSIAYDATDLRVTITDHEFRSFEKGTRFVAAISGVPTASGADGEHTVYVSLNFRSY